MTTYQVVLSIGSNVANPKLAHPGLADLAKHASATTGTDTAGADTVSGAQAGQVASASGAESAGDGDHAQLSSPEILVAVAQLLGAELQKMSAIYRTPAWGNTEQPDFYNAALLVETTSEPKEFLHRMQRMELDFGRERHEHWGPRTLDIDLVQVRAGGEEITSTDPELLLPHPYASQRAFVLVPWAEIEPEAKLEEVPITQYLAKLEAERAEIQRLEG